MNGIVEDAPSLGLTGLFVIQQWGLYVACLMPAGATQSIIRQSLCSMPLDGIWLPQMLLRGLRGRLEVTRLSHTTKVFFVGLVINGVLAERSIGIFQCQRITIGPEDALSPCQPFLQSQENICWDSGVSRMAEKGLTVLKVNSFGCSPSYEQNREITASKDDPANDQFVRGPTGCVYDLPTSWLFPAFDDGEYERSKEQNLGADGRAERTLLTSWAPSRSYQRESRLWKHFLRGTESARVPLQELIMPHGAPANATDRYGLAHTSYS